MRQIKKYWGPQVSTSRQLELALRQQAFEENEKRIGWIVVLVIAGFVSLVVSTAIHIHLLAAVAPFSLALIILAFRIWIKNKAAARMPAFRSAHLSVIFKGSQRPRQIYKQFLIDGID